MLNAKQTKFIQDQAKTENGQMWLEVFKTLVEGLYSTRGINEADWKSRQIAAKEIENELIKRLEVGNQEVTKAKVNEYI